MQNRYSVVRDGIENSKRISHKRNNADAGPLWDLFATLGHRGYPSNSRTDVGTKRRGHPRPVCAAAIVTNVFEIDLRAGRVRDVHA